MASRYPLHSWNEKWNFWSWFLLILSLLSKRSAVMFYHRRTDCATLQAVTWVVIFPIVAQGNRDSLWAPIILQDACWGFLMDGSRGWKSTESWWTVVQSCHLETTRTLSLPRAEMRPGKNSVPFTSMNLNDWKGRTWNCTFTGTDQYRKRRTHKEYYPIELQPSRNHVIFGEVR